LSGLAADLAAAIAELDALPVAVFGHSMGAWLGLEVVRRLEAMGINPVRFFASGRQAPGLGCTQPMLSHLSDAAFVEEVQTRYGGIPREILVEEELLALLLPALRADIGLLEHYVHRPAGPVSTPIHGLVGDSDSVVSVEEMAPWAEEAAGGFEVTTLPGGHFYFQPDARPLLGVLRRQLVAPEAAAPVQLRTL
jgi:surfactin synthase thioesterase subunit